MLIYYINLLLIVGLGIWAWEYKPSKAKTIVYLTVTVGFMLALYTLRYGIGYDFYSYRAIFTDIAALDNPFGHYMFKSAPLFAGLSYLIGLFSSSYTVAMFVWGLFTFGLLAFAVYRQKLVPWVALFAFVTLLFFYQSMNFVRQAMAAVILLFAISYLKEQKLLPYMLIVLAASGFHLYALVFIPAYWLLLWRPSPKHYGIVGGLAIVGFVFSPQIFYWLGQASPQIGKYIQSYYFQAPGDPKAIILPILGLIVFLAFNRLLVGQHPKNYIYANAAFYAVIFGLLSIRHLIVARVSIYFMVFFIFALAEIATALKTAATTQTVPQAGASPKASKKAAKESAFNYRYFLGGVIVVLLCNHWAAALTREHGALPYHSRFDQLWCARADYVYYQIDGQGWPNRTIYENEFPEELQYKA